MAPDPMLMNCNEFSAQADTNCPLHPATNDFPSPLPQGVTDALQQVEKHLSTVLNSTNVVRWLYTVPKVYTLLFYCWINDYYSRQIVFVPFMQPAMV